MYIRACRVRQAYDPTEIKIAFAITGKLEKYRVNTIDSLIRVGGQYKTGKAPSLAIERELQKLLDSWAV